MTTNMIMQPSPNRFWPTWVNLSRAAGLAETNRARMIEAIKQPDSHHVLAAQGWLELGNLAEATHELEQINPTWQEHPEVLEIRWQIHACSKSWDECVRFAAAMIRANPTSAVGWIHRSYALHEMQR